MLDIIIKDPEKTFNFEGISSAFKFPTLHIHQKQFATTRARFPLSIGAVGSGKSLALIVRSLYLSVKTPYFGDLSGNEGIMGRLVRGDLEDTTMADFFEFVPSEWQKRWQGGNKLIWTFPNMSTIQFVPMERISKFRSRQLGFAAFEEINEIPQKIFEQIAIRRMRRLYTRNRAMVTFHTAFGAMNPEDAGWASGVWQKNEEFLDSKLLTERRKFDPNYLVIHSSTYDNKENLPKDYIPNMEKYYGGKDTPEGKRYLMGEWGSLEGHIYRFDKDVHILDEDFWPPLDWDTIVSLDYAISGWNCASFIAIEKLGIGRSKFYVYDEAYMEDVTAEEWVEELDNKLQYHAIMRAEAHGEKNIPLRPKVKYWKCDPAMEQTMARVRKVEIKRTVKETLQRLGKELGLKLFLIPANNNLDLGIDRVRWLLNNTLLVFNPRVINHARCLKKYVMDKEKGKPKLQQEDHPCDTVRYGVVDIPIRDYKPKDKRKPSMMDKIRDNVLGAEIRKIDLVEEMI